MKNSIFRRVLLFVAIMTSLMIVCLSISFADSEETKEIEQNQEIQSKHEKESLSQQGDNQNQDVVNNESTESDIKNGETKSDESVKSSANSIAKNTSQTPSVNPLDIFEIIRLGGSDRYATSRVIADEFKKKHGADKFGCIILTCGDDFALWQPTHTTQIPECTQRQLFVVAQAWK